MKEPRDMPAQDTKLNHSSGGEYVDVVSQIELFCVQNGDDQAFCREIEPILGKNGVHGCRSGLRQN